MSWGNFGRDLPTGLQDPIRVKRLIAKVGEKRGAACFGSSPCFFHLLLRAWLKAIAEQEGLVILPVVPDIRRQLNRPLER